MFESLASPCGLRCSATLNMTGFGKRFATGSTQKIGFVALAALCAGILQAAEEKTSDAQVLIPWLLREDHALKGIPFADVIAATSGKKIIPVNRQNPADARVLSKIAEAINTVLRKMNSPDSDVQRIARINEV